MSPYITGNLLFLLILTGTVISNQGQDLGHFWLISDLHYDFTYEVQDQPESCRSIIPKSQLGQFGAYECDPPWILLNQTIYSMKQLAPDVDFILWTGDSVMHTRRDERLTLNQTVNVNIIKDITNLIKEAFPDVALVPSIGNHDYFPNAQTSTAMLDGFAKAWFNESELHTDTFKKGGYYSVDISPRIRLLNLNTILFYKSNKNINPTTTPDPAGQFDWLQKQLDESRRKNMKVFICGHIAPGVTASGKTWWYSSYNNRFIRLVQQYTDVINAMFFGHDHKTTFKIITANGTGSVPIFIAASVTPWTYDYNHNPAMWLVTYDRQTVMPVKIDQYYVDLLRANRERKLQYRIGYSIPNEYLMKDISGKSLMDLREAMKTNAGFFERYIKHMSADVTTKKQPEINLDLKITVLCAMNSMDEKSFGVCRAHGIKPVNGALKVSINTTLLLITLIIAALN